MKKMILLTIIVIAMMGSNLTALEFSLTIDEVRPFYVSGTLLITNPGTQDVILEFPTAGNFDLMVDGNITSVVYPSILSAVLIPAEATISETVSYVGFTPLLPGSHVAQARAVLLGDPPVGNPQTFIYDPEPLSNVYDLEYDFSITSVSQEGISGTLQMYNPNQLPWQLSFPNAIVARIFVDDQAPSAMYPPMSITVQINPGESHIEEIFHSRETGYSPGAHVAEARLFLNENIPVGAAQTFYVEPSSSEGTFTPELPMLSLKVGPNPCRDHLTISSSSKQLQIISIYDIRGRKVFETSGSGDFTWNGRDYNQRACPAGLYYVIASQGDRTAIKRFVKL